ncbi:TlpA disulfide reductase family protein [Pontibacter sp. SGAir0037]|uniref:TlpA disulfide reductase family protein n=1 Tax=Pontibacter sp. SGAir0037 TaxID=2571030 RepID=UPI0010CD661E|nr:TlpA disulfide reductase family protein [Pontibacter sp. SGAir0037]QCR22331.1 hypothetical protein C1N53_08270 [Pontibacter sp. SGAir0037]
MGVWLGYFPFKSKTNASMTAKYLPSLSCLVLGLLLFPLCAVAQALYPYKITGKLAAGSGETVYLAKGTYIPNDSKQPIDSVKLRNNGFRLSGKVATPGPYSLFIKGQPSFKIIYLDGSQLRVDGEARAIHEARVSGSRDMEVLGVFSQEVAAIKKSEEAVINEMKEYGKRQEIQLLKASKLKLDSIQAYLHGTINRLVGQYPASYAALYYLDIYGEKVMPTDQVMALLDNMPRVYKAVPLHGELKAKLWASQNLKEGSPVIHFSLPDSAGTMFRTTANKGYWLLDFWASWCGPCRAEHPRLRALYEEFADNGFTILSVSIDTNREAWLKAVQKDKLTWQQVIAIEGKSNLAIARYGIHEIPINYLIGPDGTIIGKNLKGQQLRDKLLDLYGAQVSKERK